MNEIIGAILSPASIDFILNIVWILVKIAIVVGIGLLHVAYATYWETKYRPVSRFRYWLPDALTRQRAG